MQSPGPQNAKGKENARLAYFVFVHVNIFFYCHFSMETYRLYCHLCRKHATKAVGVTKKLWPNECQRCGQPFCNKTRVSRRHTFRCGMPTRLSIRRKIKKLKKESQGNDEGDVRDILMLLRCLKHQC